LVSGATKGEIITKNSGNDSRGRIKACGCRYDSAKVEGINQHVGKEKACPKRNPMSKEVTGGK